MAKTIIKELAITLLLGLAIMLTLGILMYKYIPSVKTIPNAVAYNTPDDVKGILEEVGNTDEDQIIMTYEVKASDLRDYKKVQDYKPGKANPFSSYVSPTTEGENSSQAATNPENETTQSNQEGHFFQNKGGK